MILHLKFLDHISLSNQWHDRDELVNEKPHVCEVVGFVEHETDLAYYLSTMRGGEDIGSCHVIVKSTVISITEYP